MSRAWSSRCDSNFNPRNKVLFETFLAHSIACQHASVFFPVVHKVSEMIVKDFIRVRIVLQTAVDYGSDSGDDRPDETSRIMEIARCILKRLSEFGDFKAFYPGKDNTELLTAIIDDLSSIRSKSLYRQMAIQRAYFMLFIDPDKSASEVTRLSIKQSWSAMNLTCFMNDVHCLLGPDYASTIRARRQASRRKSVQRVGILDQATFDCCLSMRQQRTLMAMPAHTRGMDVWRVTTVGRFTREGMFKYQMPQLCGPSGTVALRLALALQADLSPDELKHYAFFVALFTVAVGAHTVDEVFSINAYAGLSDYQRGDYGSIFGESLGLPADILIAASQLSQRYLG